MRQDLRHAAIAGTAAVLVAVCAAGCGSPSNSASSGNKGQGPSYPSSAAPVVVGQTTSQGLRSKPIQPVSELVKNPEAELVIEGTVRSVSYTMLGDAIPSTIMEVAVIRSRGTAPDLIRVYESGGLIPVSDLPESDRNKLTAVDGKPMPTNAVFDHLGAGAAPHPRVGDVVVLFLHRFSGPGVEGLAFAGIDATYTRFTKVADGSYVRAGKDDGVDQVLNEAQLATALRVS